MRSSYNILLGVFRYKKDGVNSHLYGILSMKEGELDYRISYVGEKQLLKLYSESPDSFDFSIKDGLVYWRGGPMDIDVHIATRNLNVSSTMGLSENSFYKFFWYLVSNGYYYVTNKSPFIEGNPDRFTAKGLTKFTNLVFPENSLGVYLLHRDSKGKPTYSPLLTMEGVSSFNVLSTLKVIPQEFSDYMTHVRTVEVNDIEYHVYRVSLEGTYVPVMRSLGQYNPNLICFLKSMTVKFSALLYGIDRVFTINSKNSKSPVVLDILRGDLSHLSDNSIKVDYNMEPNYEVLDLVIDDMIINPGNLEVTLKDRLKELTEIERFVITNLVSIQLKNVTKTNSGYLHHLLSWREKVQTKLNFFEMMLLIQRSSLTANRPSSLSLKRKGICGYTKGETMLRG